MNYFIFLTLFLSIFTAGCTKDAKPSSNPKIPETNEVHKESDELTKKLDRETKVELHLIGATSDERFQFSYTSNFNEPLRLLAFVERVYKLKPKNNPTGSISFYVDSFDSLNEANFEKCTSNKALGVTRTVCAIKNCVHIPLIPETSFSFSSAQCEFNNLDARKQYSFFAYYSGDSEYSDSQSSDSILLRINPVSFGELTLSSNTFHSSFYEDVTFEAKLNYFGTFPIGKIQFYIDKEFFPICSQNINGETVMSCTTKRLHVGENIINAVFINDNENYASLESNIITVNTTAHDS